MKRLFHSLLCFVLPLAVYAEENTPPTCEPVAVTQETVALDGKKPMVALIRNTSTNNLWITHPVKDPSASAGWSSQLDSNNWSALAVDQPNFEISCIESKPGHEQQVPCVGVISICQLSTMKIPEQLKGTFWAGENMSLSALLAYLGNRGFSLPKAG